MYEILWIIISTLTSSVNGFQLHRLSGASSSDLHRSPAHQRCRQPPPFSASRMRFRSADRARPSSGNYLRNRRSRDGFSGRGSVTRTDATRGRWIASLGGEASGGVSSRPWTRSCSLISVNVDRFGTARHPSGSLLGRYRLGRRNTTGYAGSRRSGRANRSARARASAPTSSLNPREEKSATPTITFSVSISLFTMLGIVLMSWLTNTNSCSVAARIILSSATSRKLPSRQSAR